MPDHKLDLKEMLKAIDTRDGDWLAQQPPDAVKEFQPLVALRWAVGVNDEAAESMLWGANGLVNSRLFELKDHPDLVFRLLAMCGSGKPLFHRWVAGPARRSDNPALGLLGEQYPAASEAELLLLLSLYERQPFQHYVESCGVQPKDVKGLMQAYDKAIADIHRAQTKA